MNLFIFYFLFFGLTRTRRIYFQDSKAVVWKKRRKQISGQRTGKVIYMVGSAIGKILSLGGEMKNQ